MMKLMMIFIRKEQGLYDLSAQSQLINLSISANLEPALDATQNSDSEILYFTF